MRIFPTPSESPFVTVPGKDNRFNDIWTRFFKYIGDLWSTASTVSVSKYDNNLSYTAIGCYVVCVYTQQTAQPVTVKLPYPSATAIVVNNTQYPIATTHVQVTGIYSTWSYLANIQSNNAGAI